MPINCENCGSENLTVIKCSKCGGEEFLKQKVSRTALEGREDTKTNAYNVSDFWKHIHSNYRYACHNCGNQLTLSELYLVSEYAKPK
jgi:hypothetical protein